MTRNTEKVEEPPKMRAESLCSNANELERRNTLLKTLLQAWRYEKMIAAEMDKSTSHSKDPVLS